MALLAAALHLCVSRSGSAVHIPLPFLVAYRVSV